MSFFSKIASAFKPGAKTVVDTALKQRLDAKGISTVSPEAVRAQAPQTASRPKMTPFEVAAADPSKVSGVVASTQAKLDSSKGRVQGFGKVLGEASDSSVLTLAQGIDYAQRAVSYAGKNAPSSLRANPVFAPILGAFTAYSAVEDKVPTKKATEKLLDYATKQKEKNAYKPTEAYENASTKEKFTSPKYFGETARILAPELVSSIATFGVSGKLLKTIKPAQALFGASLAGDVSREAQANGVPEGKALALGGVTGTVVGILDGIVPKGFMEGVGRMKFLSSWSKTLVREGLEIAKTGAKESGTEALQQIAENGARQTYRDVTGEEWVESTLYSTIGGAMGGSSMRLGVNLADAAKNVKLSAGLSIKEVDDAEALAIANKPQAERTPLEEKQMEQYQQRLFAGDMQRAQAESAPAFVDQTMESNYGNFKDILKAPSLRATKVKEAIESGDAVAFKKVLVDRNVMTADDADLILYSQEKGEDEVFNDFKDRLSIEDPGLLIGRKLDARLNKPNQVDVLQKLQDTEVQADLTAQLDESKAKLLEAVSELDQKIADKFKGQIDSITTHKELKDVTKLVKEEGRRVAVSEKKLKVAMQKMLGIAESINRSATKTETRKAIKDMTETQKSRVIKMREVTLLKKKIQDVARGAREGALGERRTSQDMRSQIRFLINESNLSPAEKASLRGMALFTDINSNTDMQGKVDALIERIGRAEEISSLDKLGADLEKKIASLKREPVAGKTPDKSKAKLEASIQGLINWAFNKDGKTGFYAYTKENGEINTAIAKEQIERNFEKIADSGTTAVEKYMLQIENKILNLAGILDSAKLRRAQSVDDLQEVLDTLTNLKNDSQTERLRQAFNADEEFDRKRLASLDEVLDGKELSSEVQMSMRQKETWARRVKNKVSPFFDSMLNLTNLFEIARADTVGKLFSETNLYKDQVRPVEFGVQDRADYKYDKEVSIRNAVDDIYFKDEKKGLLGMKKRSQVKWAKDFSERKNLGTFEFAPDQNGRVQKKDLILSKNEMIQIYLLSKQEQSAKALERGNLFTPEILATIENQLIAEDLQFADWMVNDYFPAIREEYKDTYEARYGVPMPDIEGYIPIKYVADTITKEMDEAKGNRKVSTVSNSARARAQFGEVDEDMRTPEVLISGILESAFDHADSIGTDLYLTDPINNLRRLMLPGGEFRGALNQERTENLSREIDGMIESIAGKRQEYSKGWNVLDVLTGNFASATLRANPNQFFKQASAFTLWTTEMFDRGVTFETLKNVANVKKLRSAAKELYEQTSFLQTRGAESLDINIKALHDSKRDLSGIIAGKSFGDVAALPLLYGDKGASMSLGIPFYIAQKEKYLAQGKSLEEAKAEATQDFINGVNRTQASTEQKDMSSIQKSGPLSRGLLLFTGPQLQLARVEMMASRDIFRYQKLKKAGKVEEARRIAAVSVGKIAAIHLSALLFQIAADGFKLKKEKDIASFLLGPFAAIPIFGSFVQTMVNKMTGAETFGNPFDQGLTGSAGIAKAYDNVGKWVKIIRDQWTGEKEVDPIKARDAWFGVVTSFVSTFSKVPAKNIADLATRTLDMVQGRREVGPRELIYSDYALGVDTTVRTYKDEKESKLKAIKRDFDTKKITEAQGDKKAKEVVAELNKKKTDKAIKDLKDAEMTPQQAMDYLGEQITDGIITKEMANEAKDEYRKFYNSNTDEQRKRMLLEISKRGFKEDIIQLAGGFANPIDVANAVMRGEKIYKIEDGVVRVLRMPEAESEAFKKKYNQDNVNWKLDHTVPLVLGGLNNDDNLQVVSTAEWASYTPVENALAGMVERDEISRLKAVSLIKRLKNKEISVQELYAEANK